jgi:signal peptidase I
MEEKQAQDRETAGLTRGQAFVQDLYFWLQALAMALVVLILLFTFVGRIIAVDGPSMLPTLHHGDFLLLRSVAYTPKQGDVVVLTKDFSHYVDQPIVKRVIAVGGQSVRIDYDESKVYVDGVALDEPYINEAVMRQPGGELTITEMTVPEGSVFVLGDNRNNSSDSRHAELGAIDERYILGEAVMILLPFQDFGIL